MAKSAASAKSQKSLSEMSVDEKLRALFDLQIMDSKIDQIRTLRGELPLEVNDLEDEVEGLNAKIARKSEEILAMESEISAKKNLMKESAMLISKYEQQQANVRNNREFDSLSKEIEYQSLEIQLAEKRIREFNARIEGLKEELASFEEKRAERQANLDLKREELDAIVAETQKDEEALLQKSQAFEAQIEERYLNAYKRIRGNAVNGLAVVHIDRDSCGGCFNTLPPQRILDIALRKRINQCEHCGRILVDSELASEENERLA
ncbi:MAG: C4-type zinc ribbon domain-containing protein [Bacteroidetes bacterium]|jgi:predicted  nucleic acid-binding Zn-ribbon protein|nr:C4-type zinc ribbon domain-containing protein [Bacteroidota bacterium]MDA0930071.1 C4-type zinc ribbon domain-containing protein [Bacteroidota bacterium]